MARSHKKLFIVDGYNVLRSGSRYARIVLPDYTDDTFNVARERLINDVISFSGNAMDAIIVFDGADNPCSSGKEQVAGGVRIVFSEAGSPADKLIERIAHDARDEGRAVLVVTSDATIQDTVFGGGVDRMSAEGFCQEMSRYFEEVHEDAKPEVATKMTLADRLSPDMVQALKHMRDGN